MIGVLLMTSAFALLGTATGSNTNWLVLWSFLAFANVWLQAPVWTSAVASRFERSRGLAFAITFSGASLAALVFPLLGAFLVERYGWRAGFIGMGAIWAIVVFPVLALFFRGAQDTRRKGEAKQQTVTLSGLSVAEGLRTSAFYKLLLASGLFTFTGIGIIVHFVPILMDHGADRLAAAAIASLVGIFSIIGRLGTGYLLDRFRAHWVGAVVFLLPILASTLLSLDGSRALSQSIAAACFGLTVGAEVDVLAYLVSRHFGLKRFGVFMGSITGALGLGIAFGPLAAGMAYDRYDSYSQFLNLTMVCMAVSSLSLASLGDKGYERHN
jgi:MFS family permease